MRITAPTSGTKAPWTTCGSPTSCRPAMRARQGLPAPRGRCALTPSPGIRRGRAAKHQPGHHPPSTWPPPPVAASPQGSCFMLIEEHSSPPRNWPPTCAPPKQPYRWDGQECAGITPWPNPYGPPHNRLLLPAHLHHPRPGLHRGRHLDRRLLQPPPNPHQPRRQIPHRIRTTPSGMDNSHINKPPTTCTQAQPDDLHVNPWIRT